MEKLDKCIVLLAALQLAVSAPLNPDSEKYDNGRVETTIRSSENYYGEVSPGNVIYSFGTYYPGNYPGNSGGGYYPGNSGGGNYPSNSGGGYYPGTGNSGGGYYPGNSGYPGSGGTYPGGYYPGNQYPGDSRGYNPNRGNGGQYPGGKDFGGEGGKIPGGVPVSDEVEVIQVPRSSQG